MYYMVFTFLLHNNVAKAIACYFFPTNEVADSKDHIKSG